MNHTKPTFFLAIVLLLIVACAVVPPTTAPTRVSDQVSTLVAMTLTTRPTMPASTSTPSPTATEFASPTPTLFIPTLLPTYPSPTALPEYTCNIINQRPYDDAKFRRKEDFDIRWTIVNTGTQRWPSGTTLEYQSGPQMTKVEEIDLPRLKPGQQYDVILDAVAPTDLDTQVMVWAVIAPGETKKSPHWMCYPYIRIVVVK